VIRGRKAWLWLTVTLATSVLTSAAAFAQATATIPVGDPVYQDVDRLVDEGLITRVVVGQRPYSRGALLLLVREARARVDAQPDADEQIRSTVARLERRTARDGLAATTGDSAQRVVAEPLAALRVDALSTDAPSRTVPSNGLGTTEANLNSLTDYHEGRTLPSGSNFGIESEQWIALRSISVQVQPRLSFAARRDGTRASTLGLQSALVRGVWDNLALTVGREYTRWAQADEAGLFFSENAPPLDMIRLASDHPFQIGGVLRRLGVVGGTIQIADLGASAANSHSRLVSYKASIRPTSALELGATFENHFGGAGATNPSLLDRVIDLIPAIDIFRHHPDSTNVSSDKLLGVDGRLRIQALANLTLFVDAALEDFDFHRLGSVFTEDAAYSAGVSLPSLGLRSLSARAGVHTTGLRFYEHHLITNGIAARQFILGDDLGHDATGYSASLMWNTLPGLWLSSTFHHETRSNDQYLGSYTNPGLTGLVFQKVADRPEELRTRGLFSVRWAPVSARAAVEAAGGVERTSNFGFVSAGPQLHAMGSVTFTAYR
jgi:hypothetical protein